MRDPPGSTAAGSSTRIASVPSSAGDQLADAVEPSADRRRRRRARPRRATSALDRSSASVDRHPQVLDVHRRPAAQHDVAEQAREAEEVLVLEPRAAAPLDHLRREPVLARHQRVGEVELRRGEAVGRVADVAPVAATPRSRSPRPRRPRDTVSPGSSGRSRVNDRTVRRDGVEARAGPRPGSTCSCPSQGYCTLTYCGRS